MAASHHWDYTPMSESLFGDGGPWTWYVPTLWRALNDPHGPWEPPAKPWERHWSDEDTHGQQIAYWAPLMTLTYGVLGWVRPELGVRRWADAGRPTEGAALTVLDRWWGDDALMLTAWAHAGGYINSYAHDVAERTDTKPGPDLGTDRLLTKEAWSPAPKSGDELLLGHFLDHLFGDPDYKSGRADKGRLMHAQPDEPEREAALIIPRYAGWYASLTALGNQLPTRSDNRSWRVHVTSAPMGYLGEYRRSRVTGRWFSGPHHWHELGWPY